MSCVTTFVPSDGHVALRRTARREDPCAVMKLSLGHSGLQRQSRTGPWASAAVGARMHCPAAGPCRPWAPGGAHHERRLHVQVTGDFLKMLFTSGLQATMYSYHEITLWLDVGWTCCVLSPVVAGCRRAAVGTGQGTGRARKALLLRYAPCSRRALMHEAADITRRARQRQQRRRTSALPLQDGQGAPRPNTDSCPVKAGTSRALRGQYWCPASQQGRVGKG